MPFNRWPNKGEGHMFTFHTKEHMFCLFLCLQVSIWGQNMTCYHETDQSVISSNPLNCFWVWKNNSEKMVTWYTLSGGGGVKMEEGKCKCKKNPTHHKTEEKTSLWFVLVELISQSLTLYGEKKNKLCFKCYATIKPNPYGWSIWNFLSKLLQQQSWNPEMCRRQNTVTFRWFWEWDRGKTLVPASPRSQASHWGLTPGANKRGHAVMATDGDCGGWCVNGCISES